MSSILRVYNPVAESLESKLEPASRVPDLNGKRVGLYWNMKAGGDIALAHLAKRLHELYPSATFANYRGSVGWMMRHVTEADAARVGRECDVVIGTTADCGSCTSWLIHDMVEFEKKGVPTVAITAEEFVADARRSALTFGIADLAIVVVPLPLTNQSPDDIHAIMDTKVEALVSGLTRPLAKAGELESELTFLPDDWLTFSGDDALYAMESMNARFLEYGWTDGLPLIPPTEDRLERMLAATRRNPDDVIAVLEPGFGKATVLKIAANAVMAGCRPEFLPAIITAVECMAEPQINLRNKSMSTCPHAPIVWLNGPIRKRLGINSGACALGPGAPSFANTVIGRAVRMCMMNIGHTYPGVADMDTIGSPTKYSMCIAENEERSPWNPYHVDAGFEKDEDVISLHFNCGICELHDFKNHDPERLTEVYAGAATNIANVSTAMWLLGRRADPRAGTSEKEHHTMLICPDHADQFKKHGWSKSDVQEAVYRKARVSFEKLMLAKEPEAFNASHPELAWLLDSRDTLLPVVEDPSCYDVVVLGGAAGRGAFLYGAGEPQTKRIES
ncbi:UGSC family (seleno)protein [Paraburkholderia caffeinilytica]|uniref:UGSC family (seleno)protein n=1 Tax=Paraburkholderia caffeinilytica TaxID=1761016 RepID=UPI0038B72382